MVDKLVKEYVPECKFKPRKTDWMRSEVLQELRKKRGLSAKRVKNLIRSAKRSLEKKTGK